MNHVRMETDGTVARVILARGDAKNRLSKTMLEEVLQACSSLVDDTGVRAVVFAADGADFSAGVDLRDAGMRDMMTEPLGKRRASLQIGPRVVRAIQELPQTTVVAMQGHCLGGGGCIALACDLRVAASDLRFGMPEVLRGMNMSWRTVPLMVSHFGPARTKDLLITGRFIDAEEALLWGLANRTADTAEAARETAELWAREIADGVPPVQASMIKQTVNSVANALTPLVHMDTDQYILAQTSEDFGEAVRAFLEKRPPRYEGR